MSNSQAAEPGTERKLRSSTARSSTTRTKRGLRQSDPDGSIRAQPPKRRRRNEVKDETFHPRDSTENVPPAETESVVPDDLENGHVPITSNGHIPHIPHHDGGMRNGYGSHRETPMTIRSKPKRSRNDGGTTLAQNQCYSVKLLPSTPKELRKEGVQYRGSVSSAGQALAVTHEKAVIWDYNAHLTAVNVRSFDIPFTAKAAGPLPFGALVSTGAAGSDLGLVLISATTGKVVFYDSIDRAASLGIFQDKNASVEGVVGSLFSGETVADLVPADHAGFVLILSSGRMAQLTLRDAQGKPKVSIQFMRITEASGGLLGSFGRLWSGGFRKDLTAVHTRPMNQRGQMQAVGLTEKAEILVWDMDWSGRSEFKSSIELWEMLTGELKDLQAPEMVGKVQNTAVLDFAILDKASSVVGTELTTVGTEQPVALLLLLRIGDHESHTYALAEVVIHGDSVGISRIIQLTTYRSEGDIRYQSKPHLVLPKPGHTAFVVFEDATLMVSTKEAASPEAQFHVQDESIIGSQPELYEETVHLRSNFAVQGACEETARGKSSCVVAFVKGAGVVRITAIDIDLVPNALPNGIKISPKSKIEQAVFYGALQPDNIIDFDTRTESPFNTEEIEEAALEVSQEIFRAETAFTNIISPSPQSMEQHLHIKLKALKALARFVRQNYPALSRGTMWKLLWDAERAAAGRQLWIAFEEHVEMSMQKGKRKGTILDELCAWFVDGGEKYTLRDDLQEEEPVRKFFIGGLHRLEKLMEFAKILLQDLKDSKDNGSEKQKTPESIIQFAYQANDVWLRTLETAFTYRSENCGEYGILSELIDDGILTETAEYMDVPEFWTSTTTFTSWTATVADLSRHFAIEYYVPETMSSAAGLVREIAMLNPRLVTLFCLQAREGISWRASHPSAKDQEHARELQRNFVQNRYHLCRKLSAVGQSDAGMKLAEKYQDMDTLTDMVIAEEQYLHDELVRSAVEAEDKATIIGHQEEMKARITRYFAKYGTKWADVFFDKQFSGTKVGDKLDQAQKRWAKALSTYLRSHPTRAKLCWINDITTEDDFAHAGKILADSAETQESRIWAKKVELSMSKLALLAADEAGNKGLTRTNGTTPKKTSPSKELVLVNIQEKLEQHFYQETISAIDSDASVEIAMEKFSLHVTAQSPNLRSLLENALSLLFDHTALSLEQLLDILTLMDIKAVPEDDKNLQHSEFLQALRALDAAAPSLPSHRFDMLLQLVWKRCYIYDNWAELHLSKKKSDSERQETLRQTALWKSVYQIVRSGFLSEPERKVRFLLPSECAGSACREEELIHRFPNDDLLRPILSDCMMQDACLQDYVNDRHLDEIAQQCVVDAREVVGQGEEVGEVGEYMNGHANGYAEEDEDDEMIVEG